LESRRLLSFSAPVTSPGGGNSVAVGDFNRDGRDDVVVFTNNQGRIGVSLGRRLRRARRSPGRTKRQHGWAAVTARLAPRAPLRFHGNTAHRASRATHSRPRRISTTTASSDTATLYGRSGKAELYIGNADGKYQPRQLYAAGASPGSIAAGDFNGDGWMDIVVVNSPFTGKASFSVLLNDGVW
jgi:hypothetical protein